MALQAFAFVATFLFGSAAALRVPIAGLMIYMLTFFVHPPSRWWGAVLPDFRWSMIAAAVGMAAAVLSMRRNPGSGGNVLSAPMWIFGIYVAYMWLQTAWALDPDMHLAGTIIMTKYLVVMFLIIAIVNSPERIVQALTFFMIGSMYFGYLCSQANTLKGRVDGVGGPGVDDASSLGMLLACGVLIAGCIYMGCKGWPKWLAVVTLPLALNGLIATSSRGAFLALVAGGLVIFFLRPKGQMTKLVFYSAIGTALVLALASSIFIERIESLRATVDKNEVIDHSAETRLFLFGAQWRMFRDHPFGAGHKGTIPLSRTYVPEYHHSPGKGTRSSHNTPMSALVDQGVLGISLWLLMYFVLYRRIVTTRKLLLDTSRTDLLWLNAAIGASLTIIVVASMFSPQIKAEIYYWFIALAVALHGVVTKLALDLQGNPTGGQATPPGPNPNSPAPESPNNLGPAAYHNTTVLDQS